MNISHCCKGYPVFFGIKRKSTKKGVDETLVSYCKEHLPWNIKGHSNIEVLTEETWRHLMDVELMARHERFLEAHNIKRQDEIIEIKIDED